MPVSSWIGLQVGSASTATSAIRASGAVLPDPFVLTMATLPYRLFPLAMLAFVVALLATNKVDKGIALLRSRRRKCLKEC